MCNLIMSRKINAKIAYVDNVDLPPLNTAIGGHYAYVRKKRGRTWVHVITSIESLKKDSKHTIPIVIDKRTGETRYLSEKKLRDIRNGRVYPIPFNDGNFRVWSGINKNYINNVNEQKIQSINKKKIRRKHKFFFK